MADPVGCRRPGDHVPHGHGFHIRADERLNALETALWASIAGIVAISRWDLVAPRADVPSWALIAALGLLVPSAITNVIVLWRRPVKRGALGKSGLGSHDLQQEPRATDGR